jgi:hypothetical protein
MWIFFVKPSTCSNEFSLKPSTQLLRPPSNFTLTVKAPKMSLAVIRGIDEKLNHMVNSIQAPRTNIYWNLNVFNEPMKEENAPRLINFIDTMAAYQHIREICLLAGKRTPSNPFANIPTVEEVSDISNYCIREYNRTAEPQTVSMFAIKELKVATSSVFAATPHRQSTKTKAMGMGRQDDHIVPKAFNDALKYQTENDIADELL